MLGSQNPEATGYHKYGGRAQKGFAPAPGSGEWICTTGLRLESPGVRYATIIIHKVWVGDQKMNSDITSHGLALL